MADRKKSKPKKSEAKPQLKLIDNSRPPPPGTDTTAAEVIARAVRNTGGAFLASFTEVEVEPLDGSAVKLVEASAGQEDVLISTRFLAIPGRRRTALQKHYLHSEIWIVVRGLAHFTLNSETIIARPGDKVSIPVESIYRITNPDDEVLELYCLASSAHISVYHEPCDDVLERDRYHPAGEQPRAAPGHVSERPVVFAEQAVAQFLEDNETAAAMRAAFARAGYIISPATTSISENDIPNIAPKLWKNRDEDDPSNPKLFIEKYYSQWLPHALAKQDLRHLDITLYNAYAKHVQHGGRRPEIEVEFAPKHHRSDKLDTVQLGVNRRAAADAHYEKSKVGRNRSTGPK